MKKSIDFNALYQLSRKNHQTISQDDSEEDSLDRISEIISKDIDCQGTQTQNPKERQIQCHMRTQSCPFIEQSSLSCRSLLDMMQKNSVDCQQISSNRKLKSGEKGFLRNSIRNSPGKKNPRKPLKKKNLQLRYSGGKVSQSTNPGILKASHTYNSSNISQSQVISVSLSNMNSIPIFQLHGSNSPKNDVPISRKVEDRRKQLVMARLQKQIRIYELKDELRKEESQERILCSRQNVLDSLAKKHFGVRDAHSSSVNDSFFGE